jgi:hypothetical protein
VRGVEVSQNFFEHLLDPSQHIVVPIRPRLAQVPSSRL